MSWLPGLPWLCSAWLRWLRGRRLLRTLGTVPHLLGCHDLADGNDKT